MSSIAYVTDEKMVEYHRLCGHREMNFWRLSAKNGFRSFHKGDLLFFYARNEYLSEKALLGYAHFDSSSVLSVRQMWNRYEQRNGYDTMDQMEEAIRKAARDKSVPPKMNCLYLTDAVFFSKPVKPETVGITISKKLESYCYLDRQDPHVTVKILQEAKKSGIDLWSAVQSSATADVFRKDEIRHQLAVIRKEIGPDGRSEKEERRAVRLASGRKKSGGWEPVRGSKTDCFMISGDTLTLAIPFVSQAADHDIRLKEWFGTLAMYRIKLIQKQVPVSRIYYEVLSEEEEPELLPLLKVFNYE